jgi:hypothetical protein
MDIREKFIFVLEESRRNQYGVKDIPVCLSKVDQEINEIIDNYTNIDDCARDTIRAVVTVEVAWLLLCFGVRMATYSLRLSNQRYFTNGLLAIGMAFGVLDGRELLVILPLYCDVEKKTKLSFDDLFKQNDDFSVILKNFINRDEKDKSLECMGYILKIDENNGPTYQRTW